MHITKHLVPFGAGLKITLAGKPAALAREVNRLFNHGIVTGIPDDYDSEKDGAVTVSSYPARFTSGLRSMAEAKLVKSRLARKGTLAKRDKKAWGAAVGLIAANLERRFIKGGAAWEGSTGQEYGHVADFGARDGGEE